MNVSVIGGSIVGLACAYRLASAGCDVTMYAPEMPGTDGAGWVAGGMLGAYTEAWARWSPSDRGSTMSRSAIS